MWKYIIVKITNKYCKFERTVDLRNTYGKENKRENKWENVNKE
jgi:hypothetical protein